MNITKGKVNCLYIPLQPIVSFRLLGQPKYSCNHPQLSLSWSVL